MTETSPVDPFVINSTSMHEYFAEMFRQLDSKQEECTSILSEQISELKRRQDITLQQLLSRHDLIEKSLLRPRVGWGDGEKPYPDTRSDRSERHVRGANRLSDWCNLRDSAPNSECDQQARKSVASEVSEFDQKLTSVNPTGTSDGSRTTDRPSVVTDRTSILGLPAGFVRPWNARIRNSTAIPRPFQGISKKLNFTLEEQRRQNEFRRKGSAAVKETPKPEPAPTRSFLVEMIRSSYFDHLCAVLLVTNAVFIGWKVEYAAQEVSSKLPTAYIVVDTIYDVWFLVELVLRAMSKGFYPFLCEPSERAWNLFDTVIVLASTVELVISSFQGSRGLLSNMTLVRTVRVARIVRVARVIRVMRFFRSLRILITAILGTVKSCIWTAALLCLILYMFSIIFTQALTDHRVYIEPKDVSDELKYYYGSLPRGMFTLFKSILGGIDWETPVQALSDVGGVYVMMFVAMITFVYLAVMNVVSGLFLQSALEQAQADKEDAIQAQLGEKHRYVRRVEALFGELDTDGDKVVTLDEFESHLHDEHMQGFLQSLEMDVSEAWTLFKLLDVDQGGVVTLTEFADGCLRMKGNAKGIDIAQIMYENKWMMDAMAEIYESVETGLIRIQAELGSINKFGKKGVQVHKLPTCVSATDSTEYDMNSVVDVDLGSFKKGDAFSTAKPLPDTPPARCPSLPLAVQDL